MANTAHNCSSKSAQATCGDDDNISTCFICYLQYPIIYPVIHNDATSNSNIRQCNETLDFCHCRINYLLGMDKFFRICFLMYEWNLMMWLSRHLHGCPFLRNRLNTQEYVNNCPFRFMT